MDLQFSKFCHQRYGQSPTDRYPEYQLAIPNKTAGYLSLLKYDKPQPDCLNQFLWKETLGWAERHFILMGGSIVKDLPFQECVETKANWSDIVSDVELRASAGYPWSHYFRTKRELIEFEEGVFFRDFCVKYWHELGAEHCRPVFWTNNVKEELRPIEKLAVNKLRTFVGAPSEHVVASSMMYGDQNQRMYDTVHKHWSFVGGTKFYKGWNKLFCRLNKHPNAFELDESEYDSSLFREAMYGNKEFRWRMLDPQFRTMENRNRNDNLYREIVESLIVTQDGDVIEKDTGNPSGSGNTIGDNTLILYRLLAYAWLVLCQEQFDNGSWQQEKFEQMRTYESFHAHVEAALTGDDNSWTCSDEVVSWFNARNVSNVWLNLGVKTTSPCYEPRKLDDIWFLSAGFRNLNGIRVPIPEHSKIMASLAFHCPSPLNPRWSLLRACALRIESFWCDQSRQVIDDYIHWLLREYHSSLRSPPNKEDPKDIFTFGQVFSVYKTDTEIKQLYLCPESDQGVNNPLSVEELDILNYGLYGCVEDLHCEAVCDVILN